MTNEQIRPLALGIVWQGDSLLVFEGYDYVKDEIFYRPLGGGIELASVRYLAATENIFTCNGKLGHEIVLLYEVSLADPSFYERESFAVDEENEILTARWIPLREFQEDGPPLYPDGLLELLTGRNVTQ
jgi:hypothetical protein